MGCLDLDDSERVQGESEQLAITQYLGNGYNSKKGEYRPNSEYFVSALADGTRLGDANNDGIDDSATLMGNTESYFSVGIDLGSNQIADAITGGASGKLSYKGLDVSGAFELANQNSADEYTGTYTLFARIKPKKAVLVPQNQPVAGVDADSLVGTNAGLQPTGLFLGWHDALATSDHDAFIEQIGDEFVNAVEYGSWLLVSLKFHYRNAQDKKNIGGRLSVDWLGQVSADVGAEWSSIENAGTVDIEIVALQYGGDGRRVSEIVPPNTPFCRLDNPDNCFQLFANAVSYMKHEYPEQFRDAQGNPLLGKFKPVRYFTARYDQSGPVLTDLIAEPTAALGFLSRKALRKIQFHLERARQHRARADYLIDERPDTTPGTKAAAEEIKTIAQENIAFLEDLLEDCLEGGRNDCHDLWSPQDLQSYDETVLAL